MSYFSPLIEILERSSNSENAEQMTAYMKHQFLFYGIKSPLRKEIQKQFIKEYGKPDIELISKEVKSVWNNCNRELNYIIIDLLRPRKYWKNDESIKLAEWMILNKSWWDTVDIIATNLVGEYLNQYPDRIEYYNSKWINSENLWLIRTAIIFQLKYKKNTDFELLKQNIRQYSHSKEFFIKKAIGWSLREYSKVNPIQVLSFIDSIELQPLSYKEAIKYL
ncbi:MAG: DNA alkylation repair protein [Chlorobiota bacterium]